jgi:hypothetical protein
MIRFFNAQAKEQADAGRDTPTAPTVVYNTTTQPLTSLPSWEVFYFRFLSEARGIFMGGEDLLEVGIKIFFRLSPLLQSIKNFSTTTTHPAFTDALTKLYRFALVVLLVACHYS